MIFDWFWFAVLVYASLGVLTYFRNMQYPSMGRVLALLRAFLWPLWWATGRPGKPEGQRYG